nr:MAG TPA: hypothetical protein [Caudoviricetes sp.]
MIYISNLGCPIKFSNKKIYIDLIYPKNINLI